MITVLITTDHAADKGLGHRSQNLPAVIAGELRSQGIAKQRLLALGLERAKASNHEGGIGHVPDDLGHLRSISLAGNIPRFDAESARRWCRQPSP